MRKLGFDVGLLGHFGQNSVCLVRSVYQVTN